MKKILSILLLFWAFNSFAGPVEIIVPFPAGGTTDIFARATQRYLASQFPHRDFIVVNVPGGDGRIGGRYARRAAPDGNSIVVIGVGPFLYAKVFYNNLGFDYSDFDIVGPMASTSTSIVLNSKSKINSFREFIEYARLNKMNCGSSSPTSAFAAKYLIAKLNLPQIEIIPYKGNGPVMIDLMGGHIDCGVESTSLYIPAVQSGRVKIVATSGKKASNLLPGVPLIDDYVRGFVFDSWFGVGILKDTPVAKKQALLAVLKNMPQDKVFIEEMESIHFDLALPNDAIQKEMENEYLTLSRIAESIGIKKVD